MANTPTSNVLKNQFIVAKNTNPNYHVHIRCVGLGFEIVADMPEQTSYAIAADYESQLPGSTGDTGGLIGSLVAAFVTQSHATLDILTQQIWRNSSPIEIPLVLQFDAYDDAYLNVYRPMRLLEALAMPTSGTNLFSQGLASIGGGNILWAPNYGNNKMALTIGLMLNLPEVLLISCSNTYDTRLTPKGYPIAGQCDVLFRTPKVLSRAEWLLATGAGSFDA